MPSTILPRPFYPVPTPCHNIPISFENFFSMFLETLDVFQVLHNLVAPLCHDLILSRIHASEVVPPMLMRVMEYYNYETM